MTGKNEVAPGGDGLRRPRAASLSNRDADEILRRLEKGRDPLVQTHLLDCFGDFHPNALRRMAGAEFAISAPCLALPANRPGCR
jgi:hypothetical protein